MNDVRVREDVSLQNERDTVLPERHRASLSLTRQGLRAEVEITDRGLLAVGTLVSAILLSSAVLVHVAVKDGRRWRF